MIYESFGTGFLNIYDQKANIISSTDPSFRISFADFILRLSRREYLHTRIVL